MSGKLLLKNLKIESIEDTSSVPDNNVAKLMYYLKCVCTVIDDDEDFSGKKFIFTDYRNYHRLSSDGIEGLLLLAFLFNPLVFIDAGVFIVGPDRIPSLPSCYNKFFKITDQRIGLHIDDSMLIGGKSVKVLKIMVFNNNWLDEYYINPFKNLNRTYKKHQKDEDDDDCCCSIF